MHRSPGRRQQPAYTSANLMFLTKTSRLLQRTVRGLGVRVVVEPQGVPRSTALLQVAHARSQALTATCISTWTVPPTAP